MIEINKKEYPIRFTIGVLEQIKEETGIDLLFGGGGTFENIGHQIRFVSACTGCEANEIKEMKPVAFLKVFNECLSVFMKDVKEEQEGDSKKK